VAIGRFDGPDGNLPQKSILQGEVEAEIHGRRRRLAAGERVFAGFSRSWPGGVSPSACWVRRAGKSLPTGDDGEWATGFEGRMRKARPHARVRFFAGEAKQMRVVEKEKRGSFEDLHHAQVVGLFPLRAASPARSSPVAPAPAERWW